MAMETMTDEQVSAGLTQALKPIGDALAEARKHFHQFGDRVFLGNGYEAEYVASAGLGHVVREVRVNDDGEECGLDEPKVVLSVFASPPTPKVESDYAEMAKKLSDIRSELRQAQSEAAAAAKEATARMERLAQFKGLERLEDFIAGKITHVVTDEPWDGPKVLTFEQAFKSKDEGSYREPGLKLLCLFGKPHGGTAWFLNSYSDGSGSYTRVTPCTSEADAVAVAKVVLDERFAEWRKDPNKGVANGAIRSAETLGYVFPSDFAEHMRQKELVRSRRRLWRR
jgi:hypothetical protein